ncbi:hypothetical protein HK102_007887, partial [Quaeritorhiza haematococci]
MKTVAGKRGGLIKKAVTITLVDGRKYHLVSYFTPEAIGNGTLQRPVDVPDIAAIHIDWEIYPAYSHLSMTGDMVSNGNEFGRRPIYPSNGSKGYSSNGSASPPSYHGSRRGSDASFREPRSYASNTYPAYVTPERDRSPPALPQEKRRAPSPPAHQHRQTPGP